MGRNGEPGFGLAVARGGVELGVGARFARFGTGAGTSNVACVCQNENILRPVGFLHKLSSDEFTVLLKPPRGRQGRAASGAAAQLRLLASVADCFFARFLADARGSFGQNSL